MRKNKAKKLLELRSDPEFAWTSSWLNPRSINLCLVSYCFLIGTAYGSTTRNGAVVPRRISSRVVDLGKVHTLRISVGMATLVELPAPIGGKISGSPESDLMVLNGPQPNQIILELKRFDARPTNLILVSGKRKVVFDIIPSDPKRPTHQDIYEISGFYGAPEIDDSRDAVVIDSSEQVGRPGL